MSFCVYIVTYMLVIVSEILTFKNTLDLNNFLPTFTEINRGGLDIGMLCQTSSSEVNESFTVRLSKTKMSPILLENWPNN